MGQKLTVNEIILGSTSKFRKALLEATGVKFRAVASEADENEVKSADVRGLSLKRAQFKAESLAPQIPGGLIIGADQTLTFQGQGLEKPGSREEAYGNLKSLSGSTHYLHSSLCLVARVGAKTKVFGFLTCDIPMRMRKLSDDEIKAYLDLGEWQGVVGSYQAENAGSQLFEPPMGDTSAIMGLPKSDLLKLLRNIGINPLLNPNGPWEISF
jgi:septum formation protein